MSYIIIHTGLCIDLHPIHNTILPMSLTVVLAIPCVATHPPPVAKVRECNLLYNIMQNEALSFLRCV